MIDDELIIVVIDPKTVFLGGVMFSDLNSDMWAEIMRLRQHGPTGQAIAGLHY